MEQALNLTGYWSLYLVYLYRPQIPRNLHHLRWKVQKY
jgi:hypothetical protein